MPPISSKHHKHLRPVKHQCLSFHHDFWAYDIFSVRFLDIFNHITMLSVSRIKIGAKMLTFLAGSPLDLAFASNMCRQAIGLENPSYA